MKNSLKIFLTVFITFAFSAYVAFTLLPNLLTKANKVPAKTNPEIGRLKISDIVFLESSKFKSTNETRGTVIKFVPEGQESDSTANPTLSDDIEKTDPQTAVLSQNEGQEAVERSENFKIFPISSLARKDISILNNDRVMQKQRKGWLLPPEGLEGDVAFWRDVYSKYDSNTAILHHPRYLSIIYDVVDLSDTSNNEGLSDTEKSRLRQDRIDSKKREISDMLLKLTSGARGDSLSDKEWEIKKKFDGIDEPNKYQRAAKEDGIRSQIGQRDKFMPGLKYSGRYLGEIETIFESYGLPRELTRLIFVESMFNPNAVSSAGASGIWQFMPDTGQLYLSVNNVIDERNDPIAATHAAAKLLKHNYDKLETWPLALNAYNTGLGRIAQAKTALGTSDIGEIIKNFKHPAYAFASRNFFLEYLAALDVAEHSEKYFGPIEWDHPLRFEIFYADHSISLPDVASTAKIPIDKIIELNPALSDSVVSGAKLLPVGTKLRLPENKSGDFVAAIQKNARTGK